MANKSSQQKEEEKAVAKLFGTVFVIGSIGISLALLLRKKEPANSQAYTVS